MRCERCGANQLPGVPLSWHSDMIYCVEYLKEQNEGLREENEKLRSEAAAEIWAGLTQAERERAIKVNT